MRVELEGADIDASTRYDFTIVLPPGDSLEIIPGLLRDSIERNFGVDVTSENGPPPRLIVSRK